MNDCSHFPTNSRSLQLAKRVLAGFGATIILLGLVAVTTHDRTTGELLNAQGRLAYVDKSRTTASRKTAPEVDGPYLDKPGDPKATAFDWTTRQGEYITALRVAGTWTSVTELQMWTAYENPLHYPAVWQQKSAERVGLYATFKCDSPNYISKLELSMASCEVSVNDGCQSELLKLTPVCNGSMPAIVIGSKHFDLLGSSNPFPSTSKTADFGDDAFVGIKGLFAPSKLDIHLQVGVFQRLFFKHSALPVSSVPVGRILEANYINAVAAITQLKVKGVCPSLEFVNDGKKYTILQSIECSHDATKATIKAHWVDYTQMWYYTLTMNLIASGTKPLPQFPTFLWKQNVLPFTNETEMRKTYGGHFDPNFATSLAHWRIAIPPVYPMIPHRIIASEMVKTGGMPQKLVLRSKEGGSVELTERFGASLEGENTYAVFYKKSMMQNSTWVTTVLVNSSPPRIVARLTPFGWDRLEAPDGGPISEYRGIETYCVLEGQECDLESVFPDVNSPFTFVNVQQGKDIVY